MFRCDITSEFIKEAFLLQGYVWGVHVCYLKFGFVCVRFNSNQNYKACLIGVFKFYFEVLGIFANYCYRTFGAI